MTRDQRLRIVTKPPEQHLLYVLKEARKAFEQGDSQTGLTNLCHAVFVAADKGKQGLTDHELIHELRGFAGFGFDPSDGPEAA